MKHADFWIFIENFDLLLSFLLEPVVIRIQKGAIPAGCIFQPQISRHGMSGIILIQIFHFVAILLNDLPRVICRAVVNDNDFDIAKCLAENTVNRVFDEARGVIRRIITLTLAWFSTS